MGSAGASERNGLFYEAGASTARSFLLFWGPRNPQLLGQGPPPGGTPLFVDPSSFGRIKRRTNSVAQKLFGRTPAGRVGRASSMRQPRQRAARARRVRASGRHRALSTLPRGDASRTRVRGQQSSRLLAAEEGESHLGNRLGLWPSTCWRRRSKAACRRASPLTAAVATRRRPRSKSCCASCPLRPSSRRCAHAAGEAAGRRGHLREEDAHLRRPLPARGRLPRPEGTMAGRRRLCRLPPLAAATGCGRWTSTWMTCCAARAAARSCSCRRSKLVSPRVAARR